MAVVQVGAAVISVNLASNYTKPDFFVCFLRDSNGDLSPLLSRGRILLFTSERQIAAALMEHQIAPSILNIDPPAHFYLNRALSTILTAEEDAYDSVVGLSNALDDMLKATGVSMPASLFRPLFQLVDHLTFSKDVAAFFDGSTVRRGKCAQGLMWMIGAVTTQCTRYRKNESYGNDGRNP